MPRSYIRNELKGLKVVGHTEDEIYTGCNLPALSTSKFPQIRILQ